MTLALKKKIVPLDVGVISSGPVKEELVAVSDEAQGKRTLHIWYHHTFGDPKHLPS